jgi:hypothetical protein
VKNFNNLFYKLLSEMTTASAGVGSVTAPNTVPGQSGPGVYTGDVRAMGLFNTSKVKKGKKKKKFNGEAMPLIRRTFPGM